MILGLSLSTFTLLHVVISLIGLLAGAIVLLAMVGDKRSEGWTLLFLVATAITGATGYLFPERSALAERIGAVTLVALATAIVALYIGRLAGFWRPLYIIGAAVALYTNVFVAVAQAFVKVPFLHPLAPTLSEPPFMVAQVVVLVAIIVLVFLAVKRFHPRPASA